MAGEIVPLVMIPRFTTYAGHASFVTTPMEFITVPLDVAKYSRAVLTVFRGPLVGATEPTPATFSLVFETSHDGVAWFELHTPITTASDTTNLDLVLDRRWFRVRVGITVSSAPASKGAITCWAAGSLVSRVA